MKTILLLLCIFYGFIQPSFGQDSGIPSNLKHKFSTKKYTTKNGLSQNTIWHIFQDQQGFMWFASGDGLNRYDGKTFKHFTHDPNNTNSLGSNYLRQIYQTKNGILWFGSKNKGITSYNPKTGQFKQFTPQKNNPHSLIGKKNTMYQRR